VLGEAEYTEKLKALAAQAPGPEVAPARMLAMVLALALPLLALVLYFQIGNPGAIDARMRPRPPRATRRVRTRTRAVPRCRRRSRASRRR
jgi:hypothetical protein